MMLGRFFKRSRLAGAATYGGSGPWKSTFTKDSTTFFKQITAGSFLYQHVEN